MKSLLITTAVASALALPAFADAPEVEIEHAVARVSVIVEDRPNIGVEIEQGTSALPALRVAWEGDKVRIEGGLGRPVRNLNLGNAVVNGTANDRIRNCRSGPAGGQAGEGASVEVRDIGWVNIADAPLVVIRTPRNVNVSATGAVYGSIGRGAQSIELSNGGCGAWDVANTDGAVALNIGGSGRMRAGTSRALDVAIGGSGSVSAGATRNLEVSIGGSGDVRVARADGDIEVSIGGSGDVDIREGDSPHVSISVAGSGDVAFGGVARDVDVSMVGGGDVTIARATGQVSRSILGGGKVRIGS